MLMSITYANAQKAVMQKKLNDEERMKWWHDAKFGMFIHWGLYAIPAGEYKGDTVKGNAEWIMDKLDIPVKEYEKYAAQFNPVKFNADDWVSIAKNAGMKYIVLTSKHHEGFAMWDSKISNYDIMDSSPFKRDIIKELAEACKKADIKFCVYYSIVDWHHPQAQAPLFPNYNAGQKDQTIVNPEFPKYFENYMKPQVKELLTNYGDIGVVWFDGDWIADYTTEMGKELYNYIREIQPNTIVNNRVDKARTGMSIKSKKGDFAGDFFTPEQEIPAKGIPEAWESCMTINRTWGFKKSDHNWKSSTVLIQNLIDIVSKGGNFLLNVGPTSEGVIPQESVDRLKEMGNWTKTNAEAVYGVNASPFEKLEWGRCTQKVENGNTVLYFSVFNWPTDGKLVLPAFDNNVVDAALLQNGKEVKVSTNNKIVSLQLPVTAPDAIATVIKVKLKGAISL
ncbi:Alpha-L-fucosidase [Arcticibacter svalbardensis MN12-7]|uniref:alpha-L-fucosidase n=2 Tax=Arcticibacter TaxID=1288026 RepID=R9GS94_9SPHI|nr:Alpha-L-fucosidase [Arcticibacter svalbardensis MN12-7]